MILKLAARGVKSIANGGMDVLMCVVCLRITPDYDFRPGNAQVDTDLIDVALLTRLPSFDNDAARYDPGRTARGHLRVLGSALQWRGKKPYDET